MSQASTYGGTLVINNEFNATITNSTFLNSSTSSNGGAISIQQLSV